MRFVERAGCAWARFISVGTAGAQIVVFLIQYALMRTAMRRKLRAQPAV